MSQRITHFQLPSGRAACRPFGFGRGTSTSIATKVPEHVNCKRCLASDAFPRPTTPAASIGEPFQQLMDTLLPRGS